MIQQPSLALVVPLYNEAQVLPELLRRLDSLFSANPCVRWSVIFINDGSRDSSADIVLARAAEDKRYRMLDLSRNFGHQAALTAGLAHAGEFDAVIAMDADLQDPPEMIPELIAAWNNGAEIVLASRRSRPEEGLRRVGFDLFHRCFSSLADFPIESNTGTFGLLSRDAVAAFNSLPEKHRFFPGLRAWIGFKRAEVVYDRQQRAGGEPVVTFRKLVRYALDGIFSFSHLPLRLLTYAGLIIAGCGFVIGVFFITRRLLGVEIAFTGFTTLVTLVLFLGGIQLVGVGVLGEYLGRIYDEVKRRPHYIIRRRIGLE